MSAQDSEYVTESGRRASAYPQATQGPSLNLLASQSVRPRIQDWDQDEDSPGPDIAVRAYKLPRGPASIPRTLPNSSSLMALFDASFTELTPSLSSGSSSGSDSSIQSSAASVAVRPGLLDAEGRYVDATRSFQTDQSRSSLDRQPARKSCLFKFLGCEKTFSKNAREWYDHSKSHFRGHTPPSNLRCPYASCSWTISGVDGEEAWWTRWTHLQSGHDVLSDGEALCEKRDGLMFEHLWKLRVISSAQLQELRCSGRLGSDSQPFVTTEKSERRRQRQANPRMGRYGNTPRR